MITDEMLKVAQDTYDEYSMRAALEAVAPMLISEAMGRAYNTARAQGMWEASEIVDGVKILRVQDDVSAEVNIDMALECASDAIRNRAQELDPK